MNREDLTPGQEAVVRAHLDTVVAASHARVALGRAKKDVEQSQRKLIELQQTAADLQAAYIALGGRADDLQTFG